MGGIFRFWGIVALGLAYGQVLSPDFRKNLDELSNWQRQLSESLTPQGLTEREPWPLEAKSISNSNSPSKSPSTNKNKRTYTSNSYVSTTVAKQVPDLNITQFINVEKLNSKIYITKSNRVFRKKINFEQIDSAILSLQNAVNDINPNVQNRVKIMGKRNVFRISNSLSSHGFAKVGCEVFNSTLCELSTIESEDLTLDRDILLDDEIVIDKNIISCVSSIYGTYSTGLACIKSLFFSAATMRVHVSDSDPKVFFLEYSKIRKRTVFNIVLNNTHLTLVENGIGYGICTESGSGDSVTFRKVVQTKFFSSLSSICLRLLDSFMKKSMKIQKSFLLSLDKANGEELIGKQKGFKDMCKNIRSMSLSNCISFPNSVNDSFTEFFEIKKNDTIAIDAFLGELFNKAVDLCKSGHDNGNLVFRIYKNTLNLHFTLKELFESISHLDYPSFNILIDDSSSSSSFSSCIYSITQKHLSPTDMQRVFVHTTNAKLFFAFSFDDLLPSGLDHLRLSYTNPNSRSKRWVWTSFLSDATGLASKQQVDAMTVNQANIIQHEKTMDNELTALHNESMDLLNHINNQSDSLASLFHNEDELNLNLKQLLSDEVNMEDKLNQLTMSLEILSDVSLQFDLLIHNINLIPALLSESQSAVNAILSQTASIDILPLLRPEAHISLISLPSLSFISVSASVTMDGFFVVYSIPLIYDEFEVLRISSLPIPISEKIGYELNIHNSVVAVNSKHYSFDFDSDRNKCRRNSNSYLCEGRVLNIHNNPSSCAEEIIFGNSTLGPICKDTISISKTKNQKYIFEHESGVIIFFSPFNDTMKFECEIESIHAAIHELFIPSGIHRLKFPQNCVGYSKQLVVFPNVLSNSNEMVLSPVIDILNISDSIRTLSDEIEIAHDINMTTLHDHFDLFSNISNVESLSLREAIIRTNDFKTINKLNNYVPGQIDFVNPDSISTTTSILSYLVSIIFIIFLVLFCIKCCLPCLDCCSALCKCCKWFCPKKSDLHFHTPQSTGESHSTPKSSNMTMSTIKRKKKQRKIKESNFSLETNVTTVSTRSLNNTLQWFIINKDSFICIQAMLIDKPIIYNWITNTIEDMNNMPIDEHYQVPHYSLVYSAIGLVKKTRLPDVFVDADLLTTVTEDPDVYFNFSLGKYIRKTNNRVVCGYRLLPDRPPQAPQIEIASVHDIVN
jgi:hypothetical protein